MSAAHEDLDSDVIGTRGTPFRMRIEHGKIREFAAATQARDVPTIDEVDAIAPPTFLATAQFWMTPDSRALDNTSNDISRMLHAGEEFRFFGQVPRAGDEFTAEQWVENIYHKRGGRGGDLTFIVVLTEYRAPDGTLRAEVRRTIVTTSRAVN